MKIVNFPFRGETKYPGAELGFRHFIKEYYLLKDYILEGDNYIGLVDYGNELDFCRAKKIINESIAGKQDILFFGGDHSTTSYIYEHLLEDNEIPVIVFDAHIDKSDEDITGYYNWNVLTKLNRVIPEGLVLGVRHYYSDIENPSNFRIIDDIECSNPNDIDSVVFNFASKYRTIYLSIDFDAINPIEFPGVGFPEPGGIWVRDIIRVIRILKKKKIQIICDFVEYNPMIEKKRSAAIILRLIEELRQS